MGRKQGSDQEAEEAATARAEQLRAQGMPAQLAHAVAYGSMKYAAAIERMARRERVEQLMEKHDLSKSVATQIAMGHADLEDLLMRRRFEAQRAEHRERSCLTDALESGEPLSLYLHGGLRETVRLLRVERYEIGAQPLDRGGEPDGDPRSIHKLDIKLAHRPEQYKAVRKSMRRDKRLHRAPLEPIPKPQDRYGVSDKRLFRYIDQELGVQATLLEGEVIRGQVRWFSRFEFGMHGRNEVEITVFRHALHEIGTL